MTEQVPDTVELEGKALVTWCSPLDGYFIARGMDTAITQNGPNRTDCHRGYVAGWIIEDGLLRIKSLTSLSGEDLFRSVFGGGRQRAIFAVWFTGDLYLYEEENLEKCLRVKVEAGRIIASAFVKSRWEKDIWGAYVIAIERE